MKKALVIMTIAIFVLGFAGTAFAQIIPRFPVNDPMPTVIDQLTSVSSHLDSIYPSHPMPVVVDQLWKIDSLLFPSDEE